MPSFRWRHQKPQELMVLRWVFFQRHWQLLKQDIMLALLEFLNEGELPAGMNDTSITLIPKVPFPQRITQFRPISLCPVLYKIAAKAIANRLRACLDEVIGEEQSAFVPGRVITDNVLIAYESVHSMR
uniref:Reverse transcriptase domain-containing protein n=1 Tax=Hordeum vulgare subsp. vulgare TaxID=112509 RepID=A0A8I6XPR7_HORVV